jgi:hypothetical protein
MPNPFCAAALPGPAGAGNGGGAGGAEAMAAGGGDCMAVAQPASARNDDSKAYLLDLNTACPTEFSILSQTCKFFVISNHKNPAFCQTVVRFFS